MVNWDGFDAEDQQYVAESVLKVSAERLLNKYLRQCKARGLLEGNEPIDDVFESDSDDDTQTGSDGSTNGSSTSETEEEDSTDESE